MTFLALIPSLARSPGAVVALMILYQILAFSFNQIRTSSFDDPRISPVSVDDVIRSHGETGLVPALARTFFPRCPADVAKLGPTATRLFLLVMLDTCCDE